MPRNAALLTHYYGSTEPCQPFAPYLASTHGRQDRACHGTPSTNTITGYPHHSPHHTPCRAGHIWSARPSTITGPRAPIPLRGTRTTQPWYHHGRREHHTIGDAPGFIRADGSRAQTYHEGTRPKAPHCWPAAEHCRGRRAGFHTAGVLEHNSHQARTPDLHTAGPWPHTLLVAPIAWPGPDIGRRANIPVPSKGARDPNLIAGTPVDWILLKWEVRLKRGPTSRYESG